MQNIAQRTLRDPLDAFQVNREVKDIKQLLVDLPIFIGNGTPEGVILANIGSLYLRLDGGSGSTLYVKESNNNSTTGWVAK